MTNDKITGRHSLGLNCLFVPNTILLRTLEMNIYPDVTEQDMNKLAKLAEQEKNQSAEEINDKRLK